MGHFESECSTKYKQHNSIEMQKDEESSLLMIEACEIKTTHDKEPNFVMLNETIVLPPANIGDENSWYLDTRASNQMSGERRVFCELDTSVVGKVCFSDNSVIDICGLGIVLFKCKTDEHLILSQVYYIPKLKSNIISLGQLNESENKIVIEDSVMKIYDRARSFIIMVTKKSNKLYVAKLKLADQVCLMANISNNGWIWHARYGHLNFHSLKQLNDKRMVEGLAKITQVNQFCDGCLIGKQHRTPFPRTTTYHTKESLDLVHGDLCELISPMTYEGNKYFMLLVDDFSRFMWCFC